MRKDHKWGKINRVLEVEVETASSMLLFIEKSINNVSADLASVHHIINITPYCLYYKKYI